ncbi:MAG: acyltransferase family protein [bacterium]|nr:acyltransferase family protein [bacterium]MCM1374865.1 acyltransferase family protein [Muribaculum sp.]
MEAKRNDYVDIWRIVFTVVIMSHHMYMIGIGGAYPFSTGWLAVEFFFILSGYYTVKHFDSQWTPAIPAKAAVLYTIHKYKKILPYTTLAICAEYMIENIYSAYNNHLELRDFAQMFEDMPYEILMLSASGIVPERLVPVWYLSAMFLVLPLLCYLLVTKREWMYYLAWIFPVIYYGWAGIVSAGDRYNEVLRAFAGLMLGVLVYLVSSAISKLKLGKAIRCCITAIDVGCLGVTVWLMWGGRGHYKTILLLFIIGACAMLSGKSYTERINIWKGRVGKILGKISLAMYSIHWCVGSMLRLWFPQLDIKAKLLIFYVGTFLVACIIVFLFMTTCNLLQKNRYFQGVRRHSLESAE